MIANLPSYLGGLDPDSRTQLAQLNQLSSIIAKMDSRERNIYAGALDGNGINDLNDMIRVAEQVSPLSRSVYKLLSVAQRFPR